MKEQTDRDNMLRDNDSGAIVNTDVDGLKAYKMKKKRDADIENMKCRQDNIENELNKNCRQCRC